MVYDLSLSGLRFDLLRGLEVGKVLDVELDLDHESAHPLKLELEIRWVRPVAHHFEAGARFVHLTPAHQRQLDAFLHYLVTHSA